MRLRVKDLAGMGEVLMGSLAGKRLLSKLIEQTVSEPPNPEPLFLEFDDIGAVTSSYFRESVVAFRDHCRTRKNQLYPVLANMSDIVREEVEFYLRINRDVMLSCALDAVGRVQNVTFVGDIDPKVLLAFEGVKELGEADATKIWKKYRGQERISVNAWNNRLAILSGLRLVVEELRGKTKFFRPILKGA